jgi:hypothetical protein
MDLLMGDWDRHRRQWRWARIPGKSRYVPLPEDRDQAFARYEGVILALGRDRDPRFTNFGDDYPGVGGLTYNGREQDRQLLAGLAREQFKEAAADLKARLTDEAIESAVKRLPPEWYAIDGARLATSLKKRRDKLEEIADKFYLHLAKRPDIHLTDAAELIEARRQGNGDLEIVATGAGEPRPEPHFRRVFHENETEEVRVYAHGGDDKVVVTGGKGPIKIRVVGDVGNDVLDDTQGGGTRLSDDRGANKVVEGPGTSEDDRVYKPPPPPENAPWVPARDDGSEIWNVPWLSWNSDIGLFLGWGFEKQNYGFRKHPFASSHTVRAGWAFGESTGRVDYRGLFHRENSRDLFGVAAYVSGVEVLRFYGFGNDTENTGDKDFYKAQEQQALLYPTYIWRFGEKAGLSLGPVLRYADSDTGQNTFIESDPPYGFGTFGQAGAHAAFVVESSDNPQYPRKGVALRTRGTLWPAIMDVEETYGSVSGELTGYASAGKWVTLALRGGGQRVFGDYPYRDAAYIGGGGLMKGALEEPGFTVRGFRANRFAGDGSLYANGDLRLRLGQITLIVPLHVGVMGLYDVGRVWLDGESSDTWHTSYGGGIWLSMFNYRNTLSAYVAHSKEGNIFHIGGGFTF